ncbi:MAG: segregation and condensation protein segregation and condensation protein [Candidatus Parcubacteria bacterium]|jgi:segregation and condensation protein B
MDLSQKLEGVLFYKATPMKKVALTKLFEVSAEELQNAVAVLASRLEHSGIRLLQTDSDLQLVTAPELDGLLEGVRKEELKRDIGKAGAETLAIVLYKGPISRAEIDRIRGVNSSFILRNLLIRGLVERGAEKNVSLFSVTPTLLAHLGLANKIELPNYAAVLDSLEKFEADQKVEDEQTL